MKQPKRPQSKDFICYNTTLATSPLFLMLGPKLPTLIYKVFHIKITCFHCETGYSIYNSKKMRCCILKCFRLGSATGLGWREPSAVWRLLEVPEPGQTQCLPFWP